MVKKKEKKPEDLIKEVKNKKYGSYTVIPEKYIRIEHLDMTFQTEESIYYSIS